MLHQKNYRKVIYTQPLKKTWESSAINRNQFQLVSKKSQWRREVAEI